MRKENAERLEKLAHMFQGAKRIGELKQELDFAREQYSQLVSGKRPNYVVDGVLWPQPEVTVAPAILFHKTSEFNYYRQMIRHITFALSKGLDIHYVAEQIGREFHDQVLFISKEEYKAQKQDKEQSEKQVNGDEKPIERKSLLKLV